MQTYWAGNIRAMDDFQHPIDNEFIDGRCCEGGGHWAIMSPQSWKRHGCGRLGTGYGQRYEKQDDGRWLKVEG